MRILVKTPPEETITVDVEPPHDTIGSVKAQIQDKVGVPVCEQRIIFGGKPLEDNIPLSDCNIVNGSTVHLARLHVSSHTAADLCRSCREFHGAGNLGLCSKCQKESDMTGCDVVALREQNRRALAEARRLQGEAQRAKFLDATWAIEGVTMEAGRFANFLQTLRTYVCNALKAGTQLSCADIAAFFLETERLFTPSQGQAVSKALFDANVLARDQHGMTLSVLVASFLSDTTRWAAIPFDERQQFWNDGNSGCSWANSDDGHDRNRREITDSTEGRICTGMQPTWQGALRLRVEGRRIDRMRCMSVGPILAHTLPVRIMRRNGYRLPALPPQMCRLIFKFMETKWEAGNPLDYLWFRTYGHAWTDSAAARQKYRVLRISAEHTDIDIKTTRA